VIRRGEGLIVLVNAEQRQIEVVTRVCKVVGIAAEERDVALRRHHQSYVAEPPVAVDGIDPALVETHDLASELSLLIALGLDLGYPRGSLGRLLGRSPGGDGASHSLRHVLNRLELIDVEP